MIEGSSQFVPIGWDDPTGRIEREMMAEQLRLACTPTQDLEGHNIQEKEKEDENKTLNTTSGNSYVEETGAIDQSSEVQFKVPVSVLLRHIATGTHI